jgi:hypothetical protein
VLRFHGFHGCGTPSHCIHDMGDKGSLLGLRTHLCSSVVLTVNMCPGSQQAAPRHRIYAQSAHALAYATGHLGHQSTMLLGMCAGL